MKLGKIFIFSSFSFDVRRNDQNTSYRFDEYNRTVAIIFAVPGLFEYFNRVLS